MKLLKLAGPGRIGALPDFANFPDEPTREKGLKMLFPYAPTVCHAKGLEFDAERSGDGVRLPPSHGDRQEGGLPRSLLD